MGDRADLKLVHQVARENWPISDAQRAAIDKMLDDTLARDRPREKLMVAKIRLMQARVNLAQQQLDLKRETADAEGIDAAEAIRDATRIAKEWDRREAAGEPMNMESLMRGGGN
jgi:hypothetical protein